MDKELPISKFSASLLEMSRGVEASALQKVTSDSDTPDDRKQEPSKARSVLHHDVRGS